MREQPVHKKTWLKLIAGYLIYVVLLFAFTELAENVMDHSTMSLDVAILKAINARSDPRLDSVFLVLTDLSGPVLMPVFTLILILLFIWQKERYNSVYILLTMGGTLLVNMVLKLTFQRARPNLWSLLVEESSYSFPSGHAMISMAFALTIIVLSFYSKGRWIAIVLGALYVLLIGVSRLYLGVHYPTDILGGWIASLFWVILVTKIMMRNSSFRTDTLT